MKRLLSILTAAALVAGAFSALPARAQDAPAPEIPKEGLIEDPVGDANFVNDGTTKGIHSALPGPGNNHVTGQDASGVGDLLKVWMSNDKDNVSVHFLTEDPPPIANGVGYSLFVAPGEGEAGSNSMGCLRFIGIIPGTNPGGGSYQGPPWIKLHDRCNIGGSVFDSQDGEYSVAAVGDEGVTTFTFPRSYSPLLANGTVLSGAYAQAHSPLTGGDGVGFVTPSTDDTLIGTDYTVTSGGGKDKGKDKKKKKKNKKAVPKKCKKLKGKAKKKCIKKTNKKKKGPAKCAAYAPGEEGAEAETTVVTDAATEDKPIEITMSAGPGVGIGGNAVTETFISHVYQNVQVDSKAKDTGLWVRMEMPYPSDYDLYLNNPDGSTAAHAAGFNPEPAVYNDDGAGGHTEPEAEQLDGIKSSDCQGYTVDVATATGEGWDLTVKFWLGPANYDPAAQ